MNEKSKKYNISPSEVYYIVALLIEISRSQEGFDSDEVGMSELASVLSPEVLMKLSTIFGGCKVKIPTKGEFERFYLSALVYLYFKVGMTPHEIKRLLPTESNLTVITINKMYNEVASKLVKYKIPDSIDKSDFPY